MAPQPKRDPDGRRLKVGLTVSSIAHAGLLAWGMISFAAKPYAAAPVDSLPVDIISSSEFSQITSGVKTAPKVAEAPKPFVEKAGDVKPAKDLVAKVTEKPEITPTADKPPEPPPPPPEKKPEPPPPPEKKAEPPPPEKKPEAQKPPEPKVDPIVEALAKEEARKQQEAKKLEEQQKKLEEQKKREEAKKREEQKKREEAKKREELQKQIETKLALLDKRDAQRNAATGAAVNTTASLGSPIGSAMTLSLSDIDRLRAQIEPCWHPPVGLADAKDLIVEIRLQLKRDGSLAADPTVSNRSGDPKFQIAVDTARRAIIQCQPYNLPVAKYDAWKDIDVAFDPRDMFRN